MKLKIASKKDLIQIDKYLGNGKKKWKLLSGIPYWLINSKGEVENEPYILDENTDSEEFAEFLIREHLVSYVVFYNINA